MAAATKPPRNLMEQRRTLRENDSRERDIGSNIDINIISALVLDLAVLLVANRTGAMIDASALDTRTNQQATIPARQINTHLQPTTSANLAQQTRERRTSTRGNDMHTRDAVIAAKLASTRSRWHIELGYSNEFKMPPKNES